MSRSQCKQGFKHAYFNFKQALLLYITFYPYSFTLIVFLLGENKQNLKLIKSVLSLLAHLHVGRRLTGELIGYPWIRRPSSSSVVRSHFQTSSPLKPLGQSKPNFMWSLLGKGNESLYKWSRSHDQDGRHAHI